MAKFIVKQPFRLTRDDSTIVDFIEGEQEINDEDAEHWFSQLFIDPVVEPVKPITTK